jgi:hypothetical protein
VLVAVLAVVVGLASGVTALAQDPPAPTVVVPPQVGGMAVEGLQLTATQGTWENDPTSFAFQWQRCSDPNAVATCADIPGATSPVYLLVQDDVGNALRAGVVASNAGGDSAPSFSDPSAVVVEATQPINTTLPHIDGLSPPEVDDELTADPGIWEGVPAPTFTYQWWSCTSVDLGDCAPIVGATQNVYTPTPADLGRRLRATVTAENVEGTAGPQETLPTLPVVASSRPVNTVKPSISGTLSVGQTLTADEGQWATIAPPLSYTYQWHRCPVGGGGCVEIPGATGRTYVLQAADEGHRLVVTVTAEDLAHRTRSADSDPTGEIGAGPVNTTLPTISGTAVVGQLLTAAVGVWENHDTLTFTFRWQRCNAQGQACQNIQGATQQTYRLTSEDRGLRIVVVVTAREPSGATHSAPSAPTQAVAGIPAGQTVSVSQVSLPDRLLVSTSQFVPRILRDRAPFVARFHITDTQGHPVSGADVHLVAIPYGRVAPPGTVKTDAVGWATFTLRPTARFPLRKGFLITIFARATKPGDPLLAGVSARRLVSVRINPN